ncbi:hypothetical protein AVEN_117667-1 [Araneus ventricosus]|uniref:Uncharacterized protein n=1 Tax=Araneus ventricosus TaxID=182803 RepID=A0A4Y2UAC1_ARAVE|nr:hypothetical protein AVEN_117667-1 [Araneus ventricosus]
MTTYPTFAKPDVDGNRGDDVTILHYEVMWDSNHENDYKPIFVAVMWIWPNGVDINYLHCECSDGGISGRGDDVTYPTFAVVWDSSRKGYERKPISYICESDVWDSSREDDVTYPTCEVMWNGSRGL